MMRPWAKIYIGDSRKMEVVDDESIELVVTSPPYWHLKDYGVEGQIGYGQTLHEYLRDLYRVWRECYRVLKAGRRLCINIGDQFARSIIYGRYKIIPLHAEIIAQCEDIGFDYLGSIIWQKKTTMNTTGGATVMGSYPYPPNGLVEIDYEFILLFKKPGKTLRVDRSLKERSVLTKEEWKEYFSGHWHFGGARQNGHEAMFPDELPKRLIKMFSFVGETVLDPFLGSGTTVKVALGLERNAIGFEINDKYLDVIQSKLPMDQSLLPSPYAIDIQKLPPIEAVEDVVYVPRIKDAAPKTDPKKFDHQSQRLYRVAGIVDEHTLLLHTGLKVRFLGVQVVQRQAALEYFKDYLLRKEVFLRLDNDADAKGDLVEAYVYLKNRIFINAHLIKSGIARADRLKAHTHQMKFVALEQQNY